MLASLLADRENSGVHNTALRELSEETRYLVSLRAILIKNGL